MSEVVVEPRRAGDEPQRHDLGRQGFGGTAPYDPDAPGIEAERDLCVYDGDRMVAACRTLPGGQWFGGRSVPMGGLSGVVVRPEGRGRGLARRLVADSLAAMVERGEAISMLYPTTASLYRASGYEIAGDHGTWTVPVDALPAPSTDGGGAEIRATEPDDDLDLRTLYDRMAPALDGWLDRSERRWAQHRHSLVRADRAYQYTGSIDGRPAWATRYHYRSRSDEAFDIEVDDLVATDLVAWRSALAFFAGHGTMARHLHLRLGPPLLTGVVDHPGALTRSDSMPWMLRLVDVAAAVAARGYTATVTGTTELEIVDEVLPSNAGRWRLEVDQGVGHLERSSGRGGATRCAVGTLASIYTGWLHPAVAAARGQLDGADDPTVALLTAAFAGRPTCPDFF